MFFKLLKYVNGTTYKAGSFVPHATASSSCTKKTLSMTFYLKIGADVFIVIEKIKNKFIINNHFSNIFIKQVHLT